MKSTEPEFLATVEALCRLLGAQDVQREPVTGLDLIINSEGKRIGVECKSSVTAVDFKALLTRWEPVLERSGLDEVWLVTKEPPADGLLQQMPGWFRLRTTAELASEIGDLSSRLASALSNQKYLWRTVAGIAAETSLGADQVSDLLLVNEERIARSSRRAVNGAALFALRGRVEAESSPLSKLLTAFSNRLS